MARSIDERVVEMKFDNKQFETNVKQSIQTLDKLKDNLDFSDLSTGIEKIVDEIDNIDMSSVVNEVEKASESFNALSAVVNGFFEGIGFKIAEFGMNFATNFVGKITSGLKSMTLDQIGVGWSKYEQELNAVRSIANAANLETEKVYEHLEKLSWYADETSFSYDQMIGNLTTFVNAGVDIDTAIPSIMGIANACAYANVQTQDAGHAMQGFAKAMSTGFMNKETWEWVKTVKGDSVALKNVLMQGAEQAGTLKKIGDGIYKDLKGKEVTAESFVENLADKWLSAEAIQIGLAQAGSYAIDTYEKMTEESLSTSEAMDAVSEAYAVNASELQKWSEKAFRAGQEYKTFSDAVGATKEGVSSNIKKIIRSLYGDLDQAVELSSALGDAMYHNLVEPFELVADFVESIFGSDSSNLRFTGNIFGIDLTAFTDKVDALDSAFSKIIANGGKKLIKFNEEGNTLMQFAFMGEKQTMVTMEDMLNVIDGQTIAVKSQSGVLEDSLKQYDEIAHRVIMGDYGNGQTRVEKLTEAGYNYAAVQNRVNEILGSNVRVTEEVSEAMQEQTGYTEEEIEALKEFVKVAQTSGLSVKQLAEILGTPMTGRDLLLGSLSSLGGALQVIVDSFRDAIGQIFPAPSIESVYKGLQSLYFTFKKFDFVQELGDELTNTFKGLFSILSIKSSVFIYAFKAAVPVAQFLFNVIGNLAGTVLRFTDLWGRFTASIIQGVKRLAIFQDILDVIQSVFGRLTQAVNAFHEIVYQAFYDSIYRIVDAIEDWKEAHEGFMDPIEKINEGWHKAMAVIMDSFKAMFSVFEPAKKAMDVVSKFLNETFPNAAKGLGGILYDLTYKFLDFWDAITSDQIAGFFLDTLSAIGTALGAIPGILLTIGVFAYDHLQGPLTAAFDGIVWIVDLAKVAIQNFWDALVQGYDDAVDFYNNKDLPVIGTLSDFVSNISAGFTKIRDTLRNAFEAVWDVFSGAFENLKFNIDSVKMVLQRAWEVLSSIIKPLFANFSQALKEFFANVKGMDGQGLDFFGKIGEVFKKFWDIVSEYGSKIVNWFKEVGFGGIFEGPGGISSLISIFNQGTLAGILIGIKKFVDGMKGLTTGKNNIVDGLKSIVGNTATYLDTLTKSVDVALIRSIAISIAILAGSLFLLAMVNPERLTSAMGGLLECFLILAAALKLFEGFKKKMSDLSKDSVIPKDSVSLFTGLLAISAAMLLVATAIAKLAKFSPTELVVPVLAMGAIIAEITWMLKSMKKDGIDGIGDMGVILSIAKAVKMMAIPLMLLSLIKAEQAFVGVFAIGAVLAEFVGILYLVKQSNVEDLAGSFGKSMIAMSLALDLMIPAFLVLALLPVTKVAQGVVAIGFISLAMSVFAIAAKNSNGIVKASLAMIAFASAMNLISLAIAALSLIPANNVNSSAVIITGIAGLIAALLYISEGKDMNGVALGVIGIATGITILVAALVALSIVPFPIVIIGLLEMAGMLTIVGVAAFAFQKLKLDVTFSNIANAMLKSASSVALLGVGIMALAAGIILMAPAAALLPGIFVNVVDAIVDAIVELGARSLELGIALDQILTGLTAALIMWIPQFVELALMFLSAVAEAIVAYGPEFAASLTLFVFEIIEGLANTIRLAAPVILYAISDVLEAILELILNLVAELLRSIPVFGDDMAEAVSGLADSMGDSLADSNLKKKADAAIEEIKKSTPLGKEAGEEVGSAVGEGLTGGISRSFADSKVGETVQTAIDSLVPSSGFDMTSISTAFQSGLQNGIGNVLTGEDGSGTPELLTNAMNQFTGDNLIDPLQSDETLEAFNTSAVMDLTAYSDGITDKEVIEAVDANSQEIPDESNEVLNSEENLAAYEDSGENVTKGFAKGITRNMESIVGPAIDQLASYAKSRMTSAQNLDEHSPSRVFRKFGSFATDGFAMGLVDNLSSVGDSIDTVSSVSKDGLYGIADEIAMLFDQDSDFQPVITPVLDLNGVRADASELNHLLSNSSAIAAAASVNIDAKQESIDDLVTIGKRLLSAVQNGSDLYLDETVLVGRINRRLGQL